MSQVNILKYSQIDSILYKSGNMIKKIPWNIGGGNIKITYMGIGNESISI